MKNLYNIHIIVSDEGYKFSILIKNAIVLTDGKIYHEQEKCLKACINCQNDLEKYLILDNLDKIKEWEN